MMIASATASSAHPSRRRRGSSRDATRAASATLPAGGARRESLSAGKRPSSRVEDGATDALPGLDRSARLLRMSDVTSSRGIRDGRPRGGLGERRLRTQKLDRDTVLAMKPKNADRSLDDAPEIDLPVLADRGRDEPDRADRPSRLDLDHVELLLRLELLGELGDGALPDHRLPDLDERPPCLGERLAREKPEEARTGEGDLDLRGGVRRIRRDELGDLREHRILG